MRPPSIPTIITINREDTELYIRMKKLYNSLIEYREPQTSRILIQLFMSLPSRKDFPEYFDIITKPIAMNRIRERIERQIYPDEESCMEDFKLLFRNCKVFNEDESQIHRDATELETVLLKRKAELDKEKQQHQQLLLQQQQQQQQLNTRSTTADNHRSNGDATKTSSSTTTTTNTTNTTSSAASQDIHDDDTCTPTRWRASKAAKEALVKQEQTSTPPDATSSPTKDAPTLNKRNSRTLDNTELDKSVKHDSDPTIAAPTNGIAEVNGDTESTNQSAVGQQNGSEEAESSSNGKVTQNHNYHNETSMDSTSNLSADLLASTPVEKCSLNTRRGRNSDAPKRQLLTGYIIYASEVRKQVIDKHPNQNFGDISRLVGNEWKALPHDIRSKYDQRALIHNKRVRERAQRELNSAGERIANGLHTPKLTKRKLAKLAKEQMRQHHLSISGQGNDDSTQSPRVGMDPNSSISQTPAHKQSHLPQPSVQHMVAKPASADSSTQTTPFRFVEPPTKKRLVYSDTFRKYIESLQVPNKDLLAEETTQERTVELPTSCLGSGPGRHESPEAALWALRDFMLQDAVTMRRNMEPYL